MTETPVAGAKFRLAANQLRQSVGLALTDAQQQVAALPAASNRLVYGAPATGKTSAVRALVLRLAREGGPESVLALAASRESANLLRDELALEYQGSTPGPMARTISSLAFTVLRQAALAEGLKEPELISGPEQDRTLKEVLAPYALGDGVAFGSQQFRDRSQALSQLGFPRFITAQVVSLRGFRAELRDLIAVCQEHQIDPDSLARLGLEHDIPVWVGAAEVFRGYLQRLREPAFENRHDSATLLNTAQRYLSELGPGSDAESDRVPTILSGLKTIVVDDAQELTQGAARLLRVIADRGVGLVLVGDPDAAVLGFRAADPRAMRDLVVGLGATGEPIALTQIPGLLAPGLRTALQPVVARLGGEFGGMQRAANIEPSLELQAELSEETVAPAALEVRIHDNPANQSAWLAHRLRELHLRDGLAWNEIAVIGRSGQNLANFEAELAAENIPILLHGARAALRDEFASRELLQLLRFVLSGEQPTLESAISFVTGPYCGLDSLALRRLRRALRREELEAEGNRTADDLLIAAFAAPGGAVTIKTPEGFALSDFVQSIHRTRALAAEGATVDQLIWSLWSASKAKSRWVTLSRGLGEVAVQANRNLDALVALSAAANRFVERTPDASSKEFVDFQLDLELPEDTLALNYRDDNRVSLLTPSALIGREFKAVVLVGLQEGTWPNLKARSSLLRATSLAEFASGRIETPALVSRAEIFDETRMLYKAMGSARAKVILSAVESEDLQVSQFVAQVAGEVPDSQGFNEPALTLRAKVGEIRRELHSATGARRAELLQALQLLGDQQVPGARVSEWYGARELSTTAPLSMLGEGELVYISPSQFEKFLQCPLHWFMSSHGAREGGFEANLGTLLHKVLEEANDDSASLDELEQAVESKWHTLDFESRWVELAQRKKAREMVAWLAAYLEQQRAAGITAIAKEQKIQATIGNAKISGNIDRIERSASGEIRIVDLKTGSLGKLSQNKMDDNAQLALYQLAFEHGGAVMVPGFVDGDRLIGASLIFPAAQKTLTQQAITAEVNAGLQSDWLEKVESAVRGMAMADGLFIANVNSHCHDPNGYGDCTIFLTEAVSHAG